MKYDPSFNPYTGARAPVYAKRGVVAASHPAAAHAGLEVLQSGGNAMDAAIATAAALTVVEPGSNGIGGDGFALIWDGARLHGLNASGPAPRAIDAGALRARGIDEIPQSGFIPVNVPGAPAAWAAVSERFGKLPFARALAPAIELARNGAPAQPHSAAAWQKGVSFYQEQSLGEEHEWFFKVFAQNGRGPYPGEVVRLPYHADTLERIAQSHARDFYTGVLAERMDAFSRRFGGYLRGEDLADFSVEWVDPISTNYHGFDVWEIPPNGQGATALMALNILEELGIASMEREDPRSWHLQLEAMKLAFADAAAHIADPRSMRVTTEALLDKSYAALRRGRIGETAAEHPAGSPPAGGTVYFCCADGAGNMVSYIQSNYQGFGSGLCVPETGISLHNRGRNFTLEDGHPNRLEGGKRPYHTIIPGFLTREGRAIGPFGVMGGFMQPQGHVQVILGAIDHQLNPQAALDAPRWQWMKGLEAYIEPEAGEHILEDLLARGHRASFPGANIGFGRGQIIWRDGVTGVLCAGTEKRTDGAIAAW